MNKTTTGIQTGFTLNSNYCPYCNRCPHCGRPYGAYPYFGEYKITVSNSTGDVKCH